MDDGNLVKDFLWFENFADEAEEHLRHANIASFMAVFGDLLESVQVLEKWVEREPDKVRDAKLRLDAIQESFKEAVKANRERSRETVETIKKEYHELLSQQQLPA